MNNPWSNEAAKQMQLSGAMQAGLNQEVYIEKCISYVSRAK